MVDKNKIWKTLLCDAIKYQQEFYELLPDWTVYQQEDVAYLKHNIGFALYGSPLNLHKNGVLPSNQTEYVNFTPENMYQTAEFIENIQYDPEAETTINILLERIREYGTDQDGLIHCGIVYNIIFCQKKEITKREEDAINKQIQAIPIFKIKRYINNVKNSTNNFTINYIDNNGRIYQNWTDYKNKNKLPKCTMLIPMNGVYRPDFNFPITEEKSTVWVEAVDSPACSVGSAVAETIDIVSSVAGAASFGIAVASTVTPVAPIVLTAGLVTGGISTAWSFGKATQKLVDRKLHAESISLSDKNALSAWLNLAGCTAEVVTAGGTVLLSKAAAAGRNVGRAATLVYNTLVLGKISINLVGLGFQGYSIFDIYQKEKVIDPTHIFFFATHAIFFGNTVVNAQFAHDIISSSQNNVLKDYEATLRSKRHRKAYNSIKRKAAVNNSNTLSEKAEIIRYIKKAQSRAQLFAQSKAKSSATVSKANPGNSNTDNVTNSNRNLATTNVNGTKNTTNTTVLLIRGGVRLLDPMITFAQFIYSSEVVKLLNSDSKISKLDILSKVILDLLNNLYYSDNCPQTQKLATVSDFRKLLSELEYVGNAEDILVKLFDVVVKFMKNSPELEERFSDTFDFIWTYIKMTLWDVKNSFDNLYISDLLKNIICNLHDVMCLIFPYLFKAFKIYYSHK